VARTVIGSVYNITPVIVRAAEELGLEAIATGGNVDFICKRVGKNLDESDRIVILASAEGGDTPDKLNEPSEIIIMLDEGWHSEIAFPVKTAREGLKIMASMYDPYKPT
jgi:Ni2+-binding GTPase involved in maturation of urease and hydrogenase